MRLQHDTLFATGGLSEGKNAPAARQGTMMPRTYLSQAATLSRRAALGLALSTALWLPPVSYTHLTLPTICSV